MKKLLILLAVLFAGSAQAATTNSLDGTVALVTQGGTGGTTGARQLLTSTTNFYVATTGSDSNNCSSGAKCLTIGHALAYVQANYDLGGQTVNINVADGTYTTAVALSSPFVGGVPNLIGDVSTPANCVISTTSASAITLSNDVAMGIAGFTLQTTTSGDELTISNGAIIKLNGVMNFGATAGRQIVVANGSQLYLTANYTISGSTSQQHLAVGSNGLVVYSAITVTITGTPALGTFFYVHDNSTIISASVVYSGSVGTTNQYSVKANGLIDSSGACSSIPGSETTSQSQGQCI